jgi:hypothetical protein
VQVAQEAEELRLVSQLDATGEQRAGLVEPEVADEMPHDHDIRTAGVLNLTGVQGDGEGLLDNQPPLRLTLLPVARADIGQRMRQ